MNAKLIVSALSIALLGPTAVLAEQGFGRSSVYAQPSSISSKASTMAATPRSGRSSVYVGDVPAPASTPAVAGAVTPKAGRA